MSTATFASLGLAPALADACARAGFDAPSPIQVEAIPSLLRGADLLGLAPTGSGKTAAFVLPLLQRLLAGPQRAFRRVRVLVLVPTRELAAQVGEVFARLGASAARPLKVDVVHGGVSINPQMMRLRGGADIVVATPGRLLDLLDHNALRLDSVETLVLDEADRLLDLGFAAERDRILAALPARRQNLLFSATFPADVQALADALLHEPVRVEAASQVEAIPEIEHRTIAVDDGRRTELLRHLLLRQDKGQRALVFVATRRGTEHVAHKLTGRGVGAAALHGELSQSQRTRVLQDLRDGAISVVVTTDLAARGIDVPGLDLVVNYDLPRSAADYVHRVGRTARAGARGAAISFVGAASEAHMRLIEKQHGLRLAREQVPGFEPVEVAPPVRADAGTGGIKGRRPSKKDKLRAAAADAAVGKPAGGGVPGGED
ncbi:DEAD/DEAH box helicase [Ramlibacter sp.]|uniref:DEAD/DEAH box helicase n=1 Tax=Ramlibacter sp. TaxID=1917967 RepID=UPI003D0E788D